MKRLGGIFNGTGADLTICIGFLPDWVKVTNMEGTQQIALEWNKNMMKVSEIVEGIQIVGSSSTVTALTKGNGLLPHFGKTVLTSSNQASTTYGESSFLISDPWDYRYLNANKSPGDASTADIDTWTLNTSGNNTGKFNSDVAGTYIGEGSEINIRGQWYSIVGLSAGQGSANDEVTLSHSVKSGPIQHISGKYDYAPLAVGKTTSEGFTISNTTVNVNDEMIGFEAGTRY